MGVSIDVSVMCLTEKQSHLMCVCVCVCACVFRCTSGLSNILLAHTFQLPGNQSSFTPSSSYTSLLHFFIHVHVLLLPSRLHPRTPPPPSLPRTWSLSPWIFLVQQGKSVWVDAGLGGLGWRSHALQSCTPSSAHTVSFMKKM